MRIYLDNAATSWPKPDVVYEAVDRYQREIGAAAGRGSYHSAQQAQRTVDETRAACSQLLGISDPRQLVFSNNGTAALNLAIHGLLNPGDHVVTTVLEHNSVLRPLHWQTEHNDVGVTTVGCDAAGFIDPAAVAEAILPTTRLLVISHASNVTGAVQPLGEIAQIAHKAGAMILVDGAQTAGCMPIDIEALKLDYFACGGHKSLLGPLGTGLLYIRPGLEKILRVNQQGGTGFDSQASTQPDQLPEKFEAGNLNVPALAGLGAAISFLEQHTLDSIRSHHQQLTTRLIEGLEAIEGATLFGPTTDQPRVGVVSCTVDGYDSQEFAAMLDVVSKIECRAGLHCAPQIHQALGTHKLGGLVRFSPGWATTLDDIDTALVHIATVAESSPT